MEFVVNKSKEEILDFFKVGKENHKWTDLFNEKFIDFDEINIKDDNIVILRRPIFTSPLRPNGRIKISIFEISNDKSLLTSEISPYHGMGLTMMIVLAIFLIIFTVLGLISGRDENIITIIIIAWVAILMGIFSEYFYSRSGLKVYLQEIAKVLNRLKKASR
jgi:hypothetical protein